MQNSKENYFYTPFSASFFFFKQLLNHTKNSVHELVACSAGEHAAGAAAHTAGRFYSPSPRRRGMDEAAARRCDKKVRQTSF